MTTRRQRFAAQLRALPARPGVYLMRDAEGRVIYVGKAANLRSRVRSYFGSPSSMEPKTRALSEAIADFDFIVTSTPQEALHLEATLVKRHQPFFNIRLKDDKHYPYLKVDLTDPWPRVYITRRVERDGARYFGPYASASSVRTTLDIVKKLFPWRSCTKTITGNDPRPCLDYYIKRCIAPCTGYCTKEEYDEVIQQVILFLEGKTKEVVDGLRRQMEEASERLEFERAAFLRDQIKAIEAVTEKQVTASTRPADEDVFGLARADGDAMVQVLFVRGTKMVGADSFSIDGSQDETDADVVGSFVKQFYESSTYIPKTVVLPLPVPEQALIEEWLSERRGGRVRIVVPRKGEKRRLVAMAEENAREALAMQRVKWLADAGKTRQALSELQEELNLPALPRRIECYDISNIQGTSSVGSMVVFEHGRPKRSDYKRFQIKTVPQADDFAMLQEVLRRRLRRARLVRDDGEGAPNGEVDQRDAGGWTHLPDLLIVDGGKGQLNAALEVVRELEVPDVTLVGLA
ncbi:MAG: excinuclease ABC subunit UvrC, partial [Dehalococcoidia bacterium]|nr:excinuclease ABC subunit UvrC [Dehalococcoidia bacterium]